MMKERIHPRDNDSPPNSGGGMHRKMLSQDSLMSKDSYASSGPPSGTYVIQVPKDQVYRLPPPENAHKYKLYTTRQSRRSRCHCCCCTILGLLVLLVALLAAAGGIFYLVFHPEAPSFSVSRVSVQGINVTSSAASVRVSPGFNVTVRAENPNGKIGIHYEQGSKVRVYHGDVMLCSGVLPAFYQPARNVTVFSTKLGGSDIVLSSAAREQLVEEERKGHVPLMMKVKLPVSVRVGSLKTWTMTAKGECAVVLDGLTAKAKLISKDCRISVKPW